MSTKPKSFTPTSIKKQGNKTLAITWNDGHFSEYSFRYLRQNCPCAGCNDEWTARRLMDPNSVALDLEGLKVQPVGHYALSVIFSDQHDTGIYHFDHLRAICPCESCRSSADGT